MLVTQNDMQRYMSNVHLSESQWASADDVIQGVQQDLETYLNRPIEPVLVQERVRGQWDGGIRFSITPVWKIISINDMTGYPIPFNGYTPGDESTSVALTAADLDLFPGVAIQRFVDYVGTNMNDYQAIGFGQIGIATPGVWYTIRYVGGLIGYSNKQFKLGIMRVVARELTRNHDDSISLRSNTVNATDTPNPIIGWTATELVGFDRFRRRVAV